MPGPFSRNGTSLLRVGPGRELGLDHKRGVS